MAAMHVMSNLEYAYIVHELSAQLAGRHFARLRYMGNGAYRLKIGTVEIMCQPGIRLHATKYVEEAKEQDKFSEKVNKELDNARLEAIMQVNDDRIVSFNFRKPAGTANPQESGGSGTKASLIFEMFGDGNAILVRDNVTVCASRYESFSGREIKAGAPYAPPKTSPASRLELTDRYVIVSLTKLPLGKEYALEALARAGIGEKEPGNSLAPERVRSLEEALEGIRNEARPYAFLEGGRMKDFALARLSKYAGLETKETPTLSEAADEYYFRLEAPNPLLDKLKDRLGKQKERLVELDAEEKRYREAGDYIYAHYQEAEGIIALAKAGKFDEIEKKHGGKIDKKEKAVEAEL